MEDTAGRVWLWLHNKNVCHANVTSGKTFKKILLQNGTVDDIQTWYPASDNQVLPVSLFK